MIRILHVIGSLDNGGSQALVMNLYRRIDRSKVQFDFVIDRPKEVFHVHEIEMLGGKIHVLPSIVSGNIFSYISSWYKFFNKHKEYKIIHGHVRSTAAIYLSLAKYFKLTTISHSHSISSGNKISSLIKNVMQFPIRYIADYFFSCSDAAGKWLFGTNILSNPNYYQFNNAIDTEFFSFDQEMREKKRTELELENNFVIGHVGRFHSFKNHTFLIDIFNEIHERKPDSVLLLVGDGELKNKIYSQVKLLGLEKSVIFTGAKSNVYDYLQAMDVFVFPSLFEGLGIVLIEAQSTGLRCIVSDKIPEEAFLCDLINSVPLNNSTQSWAETILLDYDKDTNRGKFHSLVKKAGYDIKKQSEWLTKFYVELDLKHEIESEQKIK